MYKGTLGIAPSNNAILRNTLSNDFLFMTGNSNQSFQFGCSNTSNVYVTINSTGIDVKGSVNFSGTFTNNGTPVTGGGGSSSTVGWSNYSSNVFTTCNVGIQTSNPQSALHIVGNTTIQGNIIPSCNNTYDLGSTTNRFRDVYLSSDKIEFGDGTIMYDFDWNYLKNYVIPPKESNATILRKLFTGVAQDHSAYIANNEVYTFGRNDYGQLGLGDSNIRRTPTKVPNITDAIAVSCGQGFTVVLRSNGQAYAFGNNSNGQLGDGTTNTRLSPTLVTGISNAIGVACGYNHVLYCLSDGKVVGYGAGDKGQLGNANSANETNTTLVYTSMPTALNASFSSGTFNISDYQARFVACGSYHSLMLLNNGQVYTFGDNTSNQLGIQTGTQYTTPQKVPDMSNIVKAGCGDSHTIIITQKGQTFGFGNNIKGQLGLGHSNSPTTIPTQIFNSNLTNVNAGLSMEVDAGLNHTIMSLDDGTVKVFGDNSLGQLGIGSNIPLSLTPFTLLNTNAYKVACGRNHSLVLLTNTFQLSNQIQAFGDNTYGQMGDNNSNVNIRYFPNNIYEGLKKRLPVSCSTRVSYNMAYIDNGIVYMSGSNTARQLGDPFPYNTNVFIPYSHLSNETIMISHGQGHFLALDINGRVYSWGQNGSKQLGNNLTTESEYPIALMNSGSLVNKNVMQVATLELSSFALDTNGMVHGWGYNSHGNLGINNASTQGFPVATSTYGSIVGKSVVALATGYLHVLALDSTGQVHAWGYNNAGQLGNNTTGSNSSNAVNISSFGSLSGKTITAIACAMSSCFALDTLGNVHAWGNNPSGLLGNNSTIAQSNPINISSFGSLSNTNIVAIKAGVDCAYAIDSFGRLHAWGVNAGRYGNGLTITQSNPILVNFTGSLSGKTITQIYPAKESAIALDSQDNLHVFGANTAGQLGLSNNITQSNPVLLSSNIHNYYTPFISSGFGDHKIIMSRNTSNSIEIFGDNSFYQIGDNTSNYRTSTFNIVFSNIVISASTSTSHSGVVLNNGQVYLWGNNNKGQCGQAGNYVTTPTLVSSITTASNVYLGHEYSIIRLQDQSLVALGTNSNGKLGLSNISDTSTPIAIPNLTNISKVSCGENHAIAISTDCNVYAWGLNTSGQTGLGTLINSNLPTIIPGVKAIDVACGKAHSCVITDQYQAYTCGLNDAGQLGRSENFGSNTGCSNFGLVPITDTVAKPLRVACGEKHTIIHMVNNTVKTFGLNSNTQVGTTGSNLVTPFQPSNVFAFNEVSGGTYTTFVGYSNKTVQAFGKQFAAIGGDNVFTSQHANHNYSLNKTGKIFTWGLNNSYQLGTGNTVGGRYYLPMIFSGYGSSSNNTFVSFALGASHTLALDTNGKIHAWGNNNRAQIGNNTTNSATTPISISMFGSLNTKIITKVACGYYFSAALDSSGQVHTWGSNDGGQLGNNTVITQSNPINISTYGSLNGNIITDISCGYNHILALDSSSRIHAWGCNINGQLGNNTISTESNPLLINTYGSLIGKQISKISCGQYHNLAIDTIGQLHAWGKNNYGQVAISSTTLSVSNAINISSIGSLNSKTFTNICCGYEHSMALDNNSDVHVWGSGISSQLGNGSNVALSNPVILSSLTGKQIIKIVAGYAHAMALSSNGNIYIWGSTTNGELGINSSISSCNVPFLLNLFPIPTGESNVFINFTGQHRCFIDGYTPQTIPQLEGLIVSANKNQYITNFTTGQQAITTNDSLPLVSLSKNSNDPNVFGIVSLTVASPSNTIDYESLQTQGDIRAQINSIGEGAMWVTDTNGPLEAGELITSSTIPGYGMKQDAPYFTNYTVAKITMDCDFTAPMQPKKQLKKDSHGNTVLDNYGSPIWDIKAEYEESYKTRYLLSTGQIIKKEEYEAYQVANSNVHKAAFVGVTYHCG